MLELKIPDMDSFMEDGELSYLDLSNFFSSHPVSGRDNKFVAYEEDTYWWDEDNPRYDIHHSEVIDSIEEALGEADIEYDPKLIIFGVWQDSGQVLYSSDGNLFCSDDNGEISPPRFILEQIESVFSKVYSRAIESSLGDYVEKEGTWFEDGEDMDDEEVLSYVQKTPIENKYNKWIYANNNLYCWSPDEGDYEHPSHSQVVRALSDYLGTEEDFFDGDSGYYFGEVQQSEFAAISVEIGDLEVVVSDSYYPDDSVIQTYKSLFPNAKRMIYGDSYDSQTKVYPFEEHKESSLGDYAEVGDSAVLSVDRTLPEGTEGVITGTFSSDGKRYYIFENDETVEEGVELYLLPEDFEVVNSYSDMDDPLENLLRTSKYKKLAIKEVPCKDCSGLGYKEEYVPFTREVEDWDGSYTEIEDEELKEVDCEKCDGIGYVDNDVYAEDWVDEHGIYDSIEPFEESEYYVKFVIGDGRVFIWDCFEEEEYAPHHDDIMRLYWGNDLSGINDPSSLIWGEIVPETKEFPFVYTESGVLSEENKDKLREVFGVSPNEVTSSITKTSDWTLDHWEHLINTPNAPVCKFVMFDDIYFWNGMDSTQPHHQAVIEYLMENNDNELPDGWGVYYRSEGQMMFYEESGEYVEDYIFDKISSVLPECKIVSSVYGVYTKNDGYWEFSDDEEDIDNVYSSFKSASANKTGVMIALIPPKSVLNKLKKISDEDVSNMHVTLCSLGDTKDIDYTGEELTELVKRWADKNYEKLTGSVSGLGVFNNNENDVLYAAMSIPHVDDIRSSLGSYLEPLLDLDFDDKFGYSPHLTLGYSDEPIRELPDLPELPKDFKMDLVVAYGGKWDKVATNYIDDSELSINHPVEGRNKFVGYNNQIYFWSSPSGKIHHSDVANYLTGEGKYSVDVCGEYLPDLQLAYFFFDKEDQFVEYSRWLYQIIPDLRGVSYNDGVSFLSLGEIEDINKIAYLSEGEALKISKDPLEAEHVKFLVFSDNNYFWVPVERRGISVTPDGDPSHGDVSEYLVSSNQESEQDFFYAGRYEASRQTILIYDFETQPSDETLLQIFDLFPNSQTVKWGATEYYREGLKIASKPSRLSSKGLLYTFGSLIPSTIKQALRMPYVKISDLIKHSDKEARERKARQIYDQGGVEFVSVTPDQDTGRSTFEFNVKSTSGETYPLYGDVEISKPEEWIGWEDVACSCFPAGTPVTMSDGSTKPIEDVSRGDIVVTHKGNTKSVLNTMSRDYKSDVSRIKLKKKRKLLTCTPNHKFWVKDSSGDITWKQAVDIQPGDCLSSTIPNKDGNSIVFYQVESNNMSKYSGKVYNLEVKDDHSYQVYGINCSNCEWGRFNYDRAPQYKYLEREACSHTIASEMWLAQNGKTQNDRAIREQESGMNELQFEQPTTGPRKPRPQEQYLKEKSQEQGIPQTQVKDNLGQNQEPSMESRPMRGDQPEESTQELPPKNPQQEPEEDPPQDQTPTPQPVPQQPTYQEQILRPRAPSKEEK